MRTVDIETLSARCPFGMRRTHVTLFWCKPSVQRSIPRSKSQSFARRSTISRKSRCFKKIFCWNLQVQELNRESAAQVSPSGGCHLTRNQEAILSYRNSLAQLSETNFFNRASWQYASLQSLETYQFLKGTYKAKVIRRLKEKMKLCPYNNMVIKHL